MIYTVETQLELDEALRKADPVRDEIRCVGDGVFTLYNSSRATLYNSSRATLYDSSRATLYDSSQATLCGSSQATLYGSSQATLCGSSQATLCGSSQATLCGSSQATLYDSSRATLCGSSQATLCGSSQATLCGSSQATLYDSSRATAKGGSQVIARDQSRVIAGPHVAVTRFGTAAFVSGGHLIQIPEILTAQDWCGFYGAETKDGTAILYKAVNGDYLSQRGGDYRPGTTPEAPDWDGGKVECGCGLHFCASPAEAKSYFSSATKFCACPVALSDIAVHPNPAYPNKVKARRVCQPIWEVDIDGNRVGSEMPK